MLHRVTATILALCLVTTAASAQAPAAPAVSPLRRPAQASPAPASPQPASPAEETAKPQRQMSPGMQAARVRQKQCGVEWRAEKAAGKVAAGAKWPQYWSACNKRLKGGTA